jgi:uncharacterized protein
MVIDLTTLADDAVPVAADIPPPALDAPAEDFVAVGPVHIEGTIERGGAEVYQFRGRMQARLSLTCARCAEPFELPVDAPVDLRFVPASSDAPSSSPVDGDEDGHEMDDEDPAVVPYDAPRIDLAQVAREQCYLALPMKPLCRPDCQGLCPQCGINRNTGTCTCENQWEDPRLAGLKSLLQGADGQPPRE